MKNKILLFAVILLGAFSANAQYYSPGELGMYDGRGQRYDGRSTSASPFSDVEYKITEGDGYLVYKKDTIWGVVTLSKEAVSLEKKLDQKHNFLCSYNLKDLNLKTVVMYNSDNKALCLTRVTKNDKKMMRLIHEGKLNIYDGRTDYVYTPGDIDKNLIKISYDNVVEDLSSFLTENTKRDLILFVNDIYGTKLDAKTISWRDLLVKVDLLD